MPHNINNHHHYDWEKISDYLLQKNKIHNTNIITESHPNYKQILNTGVTNNCVNYYINSNNKEICGNKLFVNFNNRNILDKQHTILAIKKIYCDIKDNIKSKMTLKNINAKIELDNLHIILDLSSNDTVTMDFHNISPNGYTEHKNIIIIDGVKINEKNNGHTDLHIGKSVYTINQEYNVNIDMIVDHLENNIKILDFAYNLLGMYKYDN